jgi:proline dehydrogenase
MLREGLIHLSTSRAAKAVVTNTPLRGMSRRFVPGESVDDLIGAVRAANDEGMGGIANFLGESVHDEANARLAGDVYLEILDRVAGEGLKAYVSLKFTQLGQDISEDFLASNLGRILERARRDGLFVRFDMESSEYTQRTLEAFEKVWGEGWRDIGIVLQSYLKRSAGDVARMNELGARVRLCKGAYDEPASVAFRDKRDVDANFVELMKMLLEFQLLHGVRRDLQRQLVADGYNVSVYVPFGSHWYPYLMRRLAERPANVVFMAGSVVKESPLGFLWPRGKDGRKT